MASSARIDELQKKFDENPKRYFAPLANEFRKAGDLEQAIALCRAFLPQQPAHMSGHIVFGQALFEAKQHDEARTVFETALSLDHENLIALRYLGDIARETGDIPTAAAWYRRVLDADPRNEEIAAVLAALPADAQAAAPATDGTTAHAETLEPAVGVPVPPAEPAAATPVPEDAGPLAMRESLDMPAIPEPATPEDEIERSLEVDLGGVAEASGPAPSAGRPPNEAAFTSSGPANEMGFEVMEFVPPDRAAEPARPSGFEAASPGEGDAGTPAAFVTETMAELYLQQGFHQEALNVYQQLLAQNPNDVGLRERVAQLSSGARSSVGAASVSDAVIESAQRRRTATSARTIRTFLASLASRRVVLNPDPDSDERERESAGEPASSDAAAWGAPAAAEAAAPSAQREPTPAWTPAAEESPAPSYDAGFEASSEGDEGTRDDAERSDERRDAGFDGAFAAMMAKPAAEPAYPDPSEDDGTPSSDAELPWLAPPSEDDAGRGAPAADAASAEMAGSAAHEPASEEEARHEAPRGTRLSGEMGSVNSLFTGAPVARDDAAAAEALAGAFLAPEPSIAPPADRAVAGRPSRAASNELSLDNVFREQGQRTSSEQRRSAFSFDQFFSEGGSADAASGAADAEEPSPDDIAQFNAWLEGLKKK